MKKFVWLLVLMMLCTGCADDTEPVLETISDGIGEPAAAEPRPMAVWLPDGAAEQTMAEGEAGACYVWQDAQLRLQTLRGGDIRATLKELTGLDPDKLTVMEYRRDGLQLYQSVWSSTSEEGISLGRCMVADDGNYHYCISLVSPEKAQVGEDFARICASLDLSGEERLK